MTTSQPAQRLSSLDASFLFLERPNLPQHIGSVGTYEGTLTREDLIRNLEARMHLIPRYRQRLAFPPFGVAYPVWEDAPDFTVADHVRELTLPAPADERVLCDVAGLAFAPPLDRRRPLWEMVVLNGYRGDHTGILSRVHHCMIDGISGVDLTLVLHDLTPDAEPPPPPSTPWQPAPPADPLTLLEDAVREQLTDAARRWVDTSFEALRPAEAAARAQQITSAMSGAQLATTTPTWQPAPPTPFNGPISPERTVAWVDFSFTEIRAIRSALGGTINDLMLTLIAGALGRYLRHHGFATDRIELRANVPVSMRRPEERGALGNRISLLIAPLFIDVRDPLERLRLQRTAMDGLKQQNQAAALFQLNQMGSAVPPALQAFAAGFDTPNTIYNTVCTNVPGPQIPLYMNGHKLLGGPGFGNLTANIGLFNGISSYNQILGISACVDPRRVPDPWFYIDCLQESYHELRAATRAHPVPA